MTNLYIKLPNEQDHDLNNHYISYSITGITDFVDIIIRHDQELPFGFVHIPIIECYMTDDFNRLIPYYIYPKEDIYNYPFSMVNNLKIVDVNHRGMLRVLFKCSEDGFVIKKYLKIFQIRAPDLLPFTVKICNNDGINNIINTY